MEVVHPFVLIIIIIGLVSIGIFYCCLDKQIALWLNTLTRFLDFGKESYPF